jgi:asparagine synthase (glutamine-hydrolysing)
MTPRQKSNSPARSAGKWWTASHGERDLGLNVEGPLWRIHDFGQVAVLVRGCVVARRDGRLLVPHEAAHLIHDYYERHDDLPVDALDGSFTVALLDARRGWVLLYRNLVGNGFTYYTEADGDFWFGSNLADLVESCGQAARPNAEALPAFFLFRFVPGRATLFDNVQRLLPGEMLVHDGRSLTRRQRQTFADLREPRSVGRDALDRVEATLGRIVTDCASLCPQAANLLSGGVDSSYLQALWNRTGATPVSFSVSVDHPRTHLDTEYALSMAQALNTQHRLVPADQPYVSYLLETLTTTGEPPNHVMAAYFGRLATAMNTAGFPAGVCGEGADSLFGISSLDMMHKAGALRRLLPFGVLRRAAGATADSLGWQRLHEHIWLAQHLYDQTHPQHPVNQAALFADVPAVRACFGDAVVASTLAARRTLLDDYQVPAGPIDRLHAAGFLGEAADSASLWTTMFQHAGGDLLCPFLDSRIVRLALSIEPRHRFPYRQPKALLKEALARHVPRELAYRFKLGFGQPIFEWLAPGGQLRPWVERIGRYSFVEPRTLAVALARPNWFLYSLLCYDLWHKRFIDRSLPRYAADTSTALLDPMEMAFTR